MVRPKTKTEHATLDFNSALTWSASTTIALQVIDEGKRQGGLFFFTEKVNDFYQLSEHWDYYSTIIHPVCWFCKAVLS